LSDASDANMTEVSTPHSGYHYNGAKRRFFEGWYFKVSVLRYEPYFWLSHIPKYTYQSTHQRSTETVVPDSNAFSGDFAR